MLRATTPQISRALGDPKCEQAQSLSLAIFAPT
jgi:hypothetical protein